MTLFLILWIASFVLGGYLILDEHKPYHLTLSSDRGDEPVAAKSIITWTAYALDPDNDTIFYQFYLKSNSTHNKWEAMGEPSTMNVWHWVTTNEDIGDNNYVAVSATDHEYLHFLDAHDGPYPIEVRDISNEPPTIIGIIEKPENKSSANQNINLRVEAFDKDKEDTIFYNLRLKRLKDETEEQLGERWTSDNKTRFRKDNNNVGDYIIIAEIKDGKHDPVDDLLTRPYTIIDAKI
jgi:hypothetical protein